MPGPMQSRQIGWALRIYRNSSDKVIAIDDIAIVADSRRINPNLFHYSAHKKSKRMTLHLGVGDRQVAIIQMLGDYDSITEDDGDYLNATWSAASENENDALVTFNDLSLLGDII